MPRLLQRPKPRPLGQSSGSSAIVQTETVALPPYEPLIRPLNEVGKRKLRELSSSRDTRKLAMNIEKSIKNLQTTVGNINDRATERYAEVQKQISDAEKKGSAVDSSDGEAAGQKAAQIEDVALRYTKQTEAMLRQIIDLRSELEDEEKVFTSVLQLLASAPQPRPQEEQQPTKRRKSTKREVDSEGEEMDVDEEECEPEEESETQTPAIPLAQLFEEARKEVAGDYAKLTMHERYGLNNDYIQFKRTWHDARHQNVDVPVPHASRWFSSDGEPIIEARGNAQEEPEDEDDDIVVEREVLSFKCPLSLQWIKEPYSSKVCSHTFDKANILGYIQNGGGVAKCPVAGCNRDLRAADFFYDEVFLRKSRRAQEAARADDESDTDADPDTSMAMTREVPLNIKREKPAGRRQGQPPAAEDDEDD